jgi:tetratricopeptide (TPR) repeat protein
MFKDARALIQAVLKVSPDDVGAHRINAATLFGIGDGKQAMKALERANRLDPEDPLTFCEIGRGFLRQNNSEMAQRAFAAARGKKADLACAVAGEHLSLLDSGNASAAAKEINDSLQTQSMASERSFALAALSQVKLHAGNPGEARKLAEDSVHFSPFDGEGYLALGLAAHKLKDEAVARTSLQKATELDPASARAHLALADFFARGTTGDLSGAISEYETFLALSEGTGEESRVKRALSNLKRKVAAN